MVNPDQKICRLCFASADSEHTSILKFLPFLGSLCSGTLMISQDESVPQDICSNCEFQIETALLLRKRLQFTEVIWAKYNDRQQDTHSSQQDVKPVLNDTELFLNCHVCGLNFDYHGLQTHIESEHGDGHVSECTLCSIIVGNNSPIAVLKQDLKTEIRDQITEDFEDQQASLNSDDEDMESVLQNYSDQSEQEDSSSNSNFDKPSTSAENLESAPDNSESTCTICFQVLHSRSNLNRHMLGVHRESEPTFEEHSVIHIPGLYPCAVAGCEEKFTKVPDLYNHSKGHKGFACEKCCYILPTVQALKRHIKEYVYLEPGTSFNCKVCNKEYKTPCSLRNHELSHFRSKDCSVCTKSFVDSRGLLGHIRNMHPTELEILRFRADKVPRRKGQFGHIFFCGKGPVKPKEPKVYSDRERNFTCVLCDVKVVTLDSLRRHLRRIHKTPWCPRCCLTFATEAEVEVHKEERETNEKLEMDIETYPCNKCDEKSKSRCDLERHTLDHLMYQCAKCNWKFFTQKELETHNYEHELGTVFDCPTCEATFDSMEKLRCHKATHASKLCGICGITVIGGMARHMLKHERKTFKCPIEGCGKMSTTKNGSRIHLETHNKERKFPCDFSGCSMIFSSKRYMLKHKAIHTDTKRFTCTFDGCTRAFHGKFDYDLHMRRHTGEKPFECTSCMECFYTRSLLRKHQEGCHGESMDIESGVV